MESERQWNDLTKKFIDELQKAFKRCPHCFFSESDIHSTLYSITKKELKQLGIDFQTTRDGHTTCLVHHEYPTPFRCDMQKYNFRVTSDQEQTRRGGLYKRGHYDLVIFNPEFIKNHELDVVHGKNYQKLRSVLPRLNMEPLIWACEIIYFPKNRKLPENAIKIIEQDTLKVKATLDYKIMDNKAFCRIGSVHVFTSFPQTATSFLQQGTSALTEKHKIEITLTTA
jgi:hypothetical protein